MTRPHAAEPFRPSADPWRDLDVIDSRAPRTVQATMGVGCAVALLTGAEWIVALLALQLVLGLTLGRRWCVPCRLYFQVLQPRLGEGPLEDSRAPRFANMIGLGCTAGATALFVAGLATAGWVLAGMVAVLGTFSAVSGFCVGCWVWSQLHPREACEVCEVPQRAAA